MIQIEEKEIKKYLKKFRNLGIYIKMRGSLNGNFTIHKLRYSVKNDLLKLEDKISETWLEINLNQSAKTLISEDLQQIILQLDSDVCLDIIIEN